MLEIPAKLPAIIKRYAEGESIEQLSKELKVSRPTLYKWIFNDLGPVEYRETITNCLINRIADADESLEDAADFLAIARARERMRYSRMDFERRRPHLYGQKQEITHSVNPTLNISVVPQPQIPQEKVIEGVLLPSAKDNT